MGGFASGRYSHKGNITENYYSIDVRLLRREGLLDANTIWGWSIQRHGLSTVLIRMMKNAMLVQYQQYADAVDTYRAITIYLDQTCCHYGGYRIWFRCPFCNRRVSALYYRVNFACRHCHKLTYASQLEARDRRLIRRGDKIRQQLGWHKGILYLPERRPKGMHRKTYLRLLQKKNAFDKIALAGMGVRLDKMAAHLLGPMYYLGAEKGYRLNIAAQKIED